jgi:hypothetical protein
MCSVALDTNPKEILKDRAIPFSCAPTRPTETVRALNKEVLAVKPVDKENEPVTDLKKENFPEEIDDMPKDPLRILAIFFSCEPAWEIEPVRDRE